MNITWIISVIFLTLPIQKLAYNVSIMAKRTKAQRSASAKKAARTRKRNAAKKKGSSGKKRGGGGKKRGGGRRRENVR